MRPTSKRWGLATTVLAAIVAADARTARPQSTPVEDLRREVEIMRKQLETMQQRIRKQEELIEKLSAEKAPPSPKVLAPSPAGAAPAPPGPRLRHRRSHRYHPPPASRGRRRSPFASSRDRAAT
jgi:hypothetical protein